MRAILIFSMILMACAQKVSFGNKFSEGQYEIIHGHAYLCIQPEVDKPWKYRCKHTKTSQIIEMEKIQVSTQVDTD